MAQIITANLQALVNDIFYHYSEYATNDTIEFGSIFKYALVLRDWTGKRVTSNIAGQDDSLYAGGPAVIFCSSNAEGDFTNESRKVFWDKVRTTDVTTFSNDSWTGGTAEVDYEPNGGGVQSNINAGMWSKLDSDGVLRSNYPVNVIYDTENIPTYGTYSVFPVLETWKRDDDEFALTSGVTQLNNKWGITYGFNTLKTISLHQDHFGYPTKWEFWFKTRANSPEGDTNQAEFVAGLKVAGQGPSFPWGDSGLTDAAGYWLGAHGDITQKQIVNITGDDFANIENNISNGDFVFTPYLSMSHDESNESGYKEAFVDSNDGLNELYWRFEISDSVTGSANDGGKWTDKALAKALLGTSSTQNRPNYKEFIPNRILIYKNIALTNETQLKDLRALATNRDPSNSVGNTEIEAIAASGVFDIDVLDGQDGIFFYPLESIGDTIQPLIDGISLHANRPHFAVNGPGGILLESTDLEIETDELPMVLVLERILKEDGTYFDRGEMKAKFDNWGVAGMVTYDNDGEISSASDNLGLNDLGLGVVPHVERLIYNVPSSLFESASKAWEANSSLNLYLQWGKKPTVHKDDGSFEGTYYPARHIEYKSGWLTTAHDFSVQKSPS